MSILDNINKPDPPNAAKAARLPPVGSTADRDAIIEECARVAETLARQGRNGHAIANAIHALKHKP